MIDVLRQRETYLRQRIVAKQTVGWDTRWDERERAALEWAINELADDSGGTALPANLFSQVGVSDTIDHRALAEDDAL